MPHPLRYYLPDYLFLLLVAGTSVTLDQLTKSIVRANLAFTDFWMPLDWLSPFARIVHWKNTGAAFGIFRNGNIPFMILAIIVSLAIINYYPIIPRGDRHLRVAIALQLGGALGNLIDRIYQGWVTDFLSIGNLPVFNLADLSISLGVVILLIPFLPSLLADMNAAALMKQARRINLRNLSGPALEKSKSDEPIPLGLVEVLFPNSPAIQSIALRQKVLQIRHRNTHARRNFHV